FNSSVRKTLALLTDPDYEPTDYYRAVQKLLLDTEYDVSTTSGIKKLQRTIQTVSLSLSIIIHWSVSENNLTSSLKCSARILLYSWEFIRKNSLFDNEYASQNFARVNSLFLFIYSSYLDKIHPYCMTKNGLSGYGNSFILESINIFQHIGYIGLISVTSLNHAQTLSDEQNDFSYKLAEFSKDCLKSLIMNHPATFSPVYDSHIIEISIALLVLAAFSETEFIDHWIGQLFTHIIFAYRNMGRYFPIQSDSFDDLLALNVSNTIQKTQLFQMSTLIPILAQWCAVLNLDETYTLIQDTMKEFSECNLQIWYPDSDTDEHLYTKNAGYYSGAMEASINLPETPLELKQRIQKAKMHLIDPTDISTLKFGLNYIPLVASHHYRTPILPIYWQAFNDIS
ncbi:MAG: hypothetical protein KDE51_20255, partial [Anaerolineales bacterium]|nr:hypothetical protein [Anaerolineales bacterium]